MEMATAMDTDTSTVTDLRLPFKPFSLDTRKILPCKNKNEFMEYLDTFLCSIKMAKYSSWMVNLTYRQLHCNDELFWMGKDPNFDWEQYNRFHSGDTTVQPSTGGVNKLIRIIDEIRARLTKLKAHYEEVLAWFHGEKIADVQQLQNILAYILKISTYPMAPATQRNVSFHICHILDTVLNIIRKYAYTQVPHFFTMCAVIFDVICGSNYVPFICQTTMLNNMVQKLKAIARETNNLERIESRSFDPEQINQDRQHLYSSVKHFYVEMKGRPQNDLSKQHKLNAQRSLALFIALKPRSTDAAVVVDPDPIVVPYAAHGQQLASGSSSMVTPPTRKRSLHEPSTSSHSTDAAMAVAPIPIVVPYAVRGQKLARAHNLCTDTQSFSKMMDRKS